jgi:hypothetical protein
METMLIKDKVFKASRCGAPDFRLNTEFGAGIPFFERITPPIRRLA